MKKQLLLILLIILCCGWSAVNACALTRTINMTAPGTLTDSLTTEEKQNITNLTLTGPIDARDFKCMRDEIEKLAVLDLKEALIQEYSGADGTVPEQTAYKAKGIPDYAFCNWNFITDDITSKQTLTTITFHDDIIEIGHAAFHFCTGLRGQLKLPSKLQVIGEYAFCLCDGYTGELIIPTSVISIGMSCFATCTGFTGKLIIPSGIRKLDEWTFSGCSGLSSVEIPRELNLLTREAFSFCRGLKEINSYPEVPPATLWHVFDNVDLTTCVLHVPVGTLGSYRNVPQWKDFVHIQDDLIPNTIDQNSVQDVRISSVNNKIFVNGEKEIASVEVYNRKGQMVINKMLKGNRIGIPIDKSGNYIVRVHWQDGSVSTNKICVD